MEIRKDRKRQIDTDRERERESDEKTTTVLSYASNINDDGYKKLLNGGAVSVNGWGFHHVDGMLMQERGEGRGAERGEM